MKIVSGGQTGVDRAALEVAIELGLEHGGWCPAGRQAEDGRIPARFQMREMPTADYAARTERNVLDADATLILCRGPLSGGTELTLRLATAHGRPVRVVDLVRVAVDLPAALAEVRQWLAAEQVAVLNVAGPRENQNRGIGTAAAAFLRVLLSE